MTRLYLPVSLVESELLSLPDAAARHVVQVLRLGPGAALTVFNGEGGEYAATLESVGKRAACVRIDSHDLVERESSLDLTLVQCVSKGDRMDYTVQKAVELGVRRVVPVLSARSVVRMDADRWQKKLEHWRGVIAAACEQCGRNRLPELSPVCELDDLLADARRRPAELRLVLAPTAPQTLHGIDRAAAVSLLVGPEGGLTDAEITRLQRGGYLALGMGPRVLRTETAGVAALAAMQALWGDLA